jgi:glycyl-tRNA synthetase beta chain
MSAASLTVELFTEELPPKALKRLGEAFADGIASGLRNRGFLQPSSSATPFATPRRLAVSVSQVLAASPDSPLAQKLMPVSVALDAGGRPTAALRKRLEALGRGHLADLWPDAVDGPERLAREADSKADAIFLYSITKGSPLQNGVEAALEETLAKLPIPKLMSYAGVGSYFSDVKFVRPAHRLLALHGAEVLAVSALGLTAGRLTGGHRFLSHDALSIATSGAYDETLRAEGHVIAGFAERRAAIVAGLTAAAGDATVIMPDELLDEVNALVEWPKVYGGSFDAAFLAVPQECLILTMQKNQKYFALADTSGALVNRFLVVSNLETRDPSFIVQGNERVLRARLADAKFFYDQDRKQKLSGRVDKLTSIVYHNKLGTQAERMQRVRGLARAIARLIGADADRADRAALLAKADLVTDMVGEFPELQGTMGRYYALHDGEAPAVADAIAQHYWPRFAGDALPEAGVAQAVALADKLESLAGLFGIGQVPTGDRDPFGLRRAALGVLRILIERDLPLSLPELTRLAFAAFDTVPGFVPSQSELETFVYERLRGYLRDLGYSANQIAAVVDARPADIHRVPARLAAVQAFEALPEAAALAAANKRIVNILRKSGDEAASSVDRSRLTDGAERDLYLEFQRLQPVVDAHCANGDYTGALMSLATTRPAVDLFFEKVMVMADDSKIRANRLALLRGVAHTMNRVADISRLAA